LNLDRLHGRYETLFESVTPPFAFVDLDALRANAEAMLAMSGGKPIRLATKSIRSAPLTRRILDSDPGFRGLLAFTVPEAVHLARQGFRDVVVAYPSADRNAISRLAELAAEDSDAAPALMIDSREQLDLIEGAIGSGPAEIGVCIDVDTSWWPLGGRIKIGPKRSPIRTPEDARNLARNAERRPGTRVVGLMAYEGHVAGVGDRIPGKPLRSAAIRWMQSRSMKEIAERRAAIVEMVRKAMEIEFMNGGGTGSLARTAAEEAVTEVTAGSGFYAPVLFDHYRSLDLTPAAFFCLPVVRKPSPGIATALGGGYIASGPAGKDRLPVPYLPSGLRLDAVEGAGEVQTPLLGDRAEALRLGDRIYFRHAKAGELCERFGSLHLVEGDRIVDEVPTYRGEGVPSL
jgi:D-serine deaminase-like pyridoxal phosphate-dependent protein